MQILKMFWKQGLIGIIFIVASIGIFDRRLNYPSHKGRGFLLQRDNLKHD